MPCYVAEPFKNFYFRLSTPYKYACIDANLASANPGVKIVFRRGVGDELFISAERHIVEFLNRIKVEEDKEEKTA